MQDAMDLLAPADLVLRQMALGVGLTKMLAAAARLGLADLLAEAPLEGAALAERTGQNADVMQRMMRALVSFGIFALDGSGCFTNNFRSEALRSGRPGAVRDFVAYLGSRANVAAWNAFDETLETGDSGFALEHGMGVWAWFDAHPEERQVFQGAMTGLTATAAPVIAGLYPWRELNLVCDVGGGRGALLAELLVRHPHLTGMLHDAEAVVALADELLEARGVRRRVALRSGSFFDAVPPGADAYLLKNVLHDWDDPTCRRILGRVRAASRPGAKVLLVETLTEPDDVSGPGALADVQMLVACERGRERGRAEYQALLEASGFEAGRVFEHAMISVVEGVAS
jgi:hypothetical protein